MALPIFVWEKNSGLGAYIRTASSTAETPAIHSVHDSDANGMISWPGVEYQPPEHVNRVTEISGEIEEDTMGHRRFKFSKSLNLNLKFGLGFSGEWPRSNPEPEVEPQGQISSIQSEPECDWNASGSRNGGRKEGLGNQTRIKLHQFPSSHVTYRMAIFNAYDDTRAYSNYAAGSNAFEPEPNRTLTTLVMQQPPFWCIEQMGDCIDFLMKVELQNEVGIIP
ncbi:hypothetical protein C8R44DRAFT_749294 [Mycena epipterygia]|nr:hypothetical protein C8R44DRAFT_749294 [Mycena epipterygia]